MGVTGDFAKLDTLRANMRQLVAGGYKTDLARELGRTSITLVANGFRAERNPYSEPWQPLARERPRNRRARVKTAARLDQMLKWKKRRQRILRDSGCMAASVTYAITGNGVKVVIPVGYAPVHQFGTKRAGKNHDITIPQRAMLPLAARGLGDVWTASYARTTSEMLRRKLRAAS